MPLWQAIALAVVQGLTEFLPISSTAHLALVPWLFRWKDPGLTFDVALHIGTLVAVLLYFYQTWWELLAAGLGIKRPTGRNPEPSARLSHSLPLNHNRALFWFLVVGTIPAGVVGWLFQEQVATSWRQPVVMGSAMILVAGLMAWAEKAGQYRKELPGVGLSDSLWIGFSQALALVPGVSRAGITMTTALLRHFRREAAARFSFLLSTPIIAGAALKALLDLSRQGVPETMVWPFVVGVAVSGLVGYATISFFLKFLQFGTFKIFVYYRVIFGIIILALAFFFRMEATS